MKQYVCVRITDMRGVNINLFRFDFDLTFAAFLMHPDGTIYHRYSGRDAHEASSHMNTDSLADLLDATVKEHEARLKDPTAKAPEISVFTPEDLPAGKQFVKQKPDNCIHCHQVHEFQRKKEQADGTWMREQIYMWPLPERLGMVLDGEKQTRLKDVERRGPAGKAGLKSRDEILTINGQPVATFGDVQWVLQNLPADAKELEVTYKRGRRDGSATIKLEDGWRVVSDEEISWRAYMWGLDPKPGFGGPDLTPAEKAAAGLRGSDYAFRIRYIVTWGDESATGRNAQQAGLRKDDIVISTNGRNDFKSQRHWHAWFRLNHQPGQEVTFEILRNGRKQTIKMTLLEK